MCRYIFLVIIIFGLSSCATKQETSTIKPEEVTTQKSTIAHTKKANIALLLPLSGPHKELGQAMLDAATMALFNSANPQLNLVVIDTDQDQLTVQNKLNSLLNKGTKLVIGPVFSNTTEMVKDTIIKSRAYLISFSNNTTLAGNGIFIMGFVPDEQIRHLVKFTISQNILQFYALLPADQYGRKIYDVLLSEAVASNGSVEKAEFYTNNEESLNLAASSIASSINNTSSNQGQEETKKALLIVEGGQQLKQILHDLEKYNLDFNKVQLLGSGQWDEEATLSLPKLNGAWFAGNYTNDRQTLERSFKEVYGYTPPRLATLSYDAVSIASVLIDKHGNYNFHMLTSDRGFSGVDGVFRFNHKGIAEHDLSILAINNGKLEIKPQ